MCTEKVAHWGINCDGYYPYCTECYFEPERADVIKFGLPEVCPQCGAKMSNAARLNAMTKSDREKD